MFDCGASFKGTSLNSELLQGPDLTNRLTGVLMRFCQEPVGIMGDTDAMFHQVKVAEVHVDFLRFLWWPGGDVSLKDKLPLERALGVYWCMESDHFTFNVIIQPQAHTRRGILSTVSSIYDPLGFLAPFTLPAKLLLQELCRINIGWDEEIPKSLNDKWVKWKDDLKQITNFQVSRCIKPKHFGLHTPLKIQFSQ